MAWKLFVHSLRMVFSNLGDAARISGVLYALYAVAYVAVMIRLGPDMEALEAGTMIPTGSFFLTLLGLYLFVIVVMTWVAVAWHRFVLLEERPAGLVPAWPGGLIWGYIWRSIVLGLIAVLVMIPGAIVGGILGAMLSPFVAMAVAMLLILIPVLLVLYRLSVILPAAALGDPITIGHAWSATKGASGAVFLLALLVAGLGFVAGLPAQFSGDPFGVPVLITTVVIGWFIAMVNISIMTTLYGVYIEKRTLD